MPRELAVSVDKFAGPLNTSALRLVVGIGASAGGLAALRQFFAHMPVDSGIAFVVVVHFPPQRKSSLAELLQRVTAMPVIEVTAPTPVAPDHVYVIVPGTQLVLSDDTLHPHNLAQQPGRNAPIDLLFRTLAEAYGRRAAGIVLSGMGSNGTLGLKWIKERGGLTLAQDSQDAEYDGMPASAIAAGVVDVIGPARQLPEQLVQYLQHGDVLELAALSSGIAAAEPLAAMLALLRARAGLDLSGHRREWLLQRFARRMRLIGASDLASYRERLGAQPDELEALQRELLLRESRFFRDRATMAALKAAALPSLFARKRPGDVVRAWVPSCSTGEEGYSVAILLSERAALRRKPPAIQVFATDIGERTIAVARAGRYPKAIAADVSPRHLRRWFAREPEYYKVIPALRDVMIFARQQLVRDPPIGNLDLIVCRGVLDDLQPEAQARLLRLFHFALRPDGFLLLGPTAAADAAQELFFAVDITHGLYASRGGQRLLLPQPSGAEQQQADKMAIEPAEYRLLHHELVEPLAPPSMLVDAGYQAVHLSAAARPFVQLVEGPLSFDALDIVLPELRPALRTALDQAARTGYEAASLPIAAALESGKRLVTIRVLPVRAPEWARGHLLVLFQAGDHGSLVPQAPGSGAEWVKMAEQLSDELQHVRAQLRDTVERGKLDAEAFVAANEALQASNEELRVVATHLADSHALLQAEIGQRRRVELERQQLLLSFDRVREDEQRRIARELHDQMGQYLAALLLGLKPLSDDDRLPAATVGKLQQLQAIVEQISQEVRHLAMELRPTALDDQGLPATLANYVAEWSRRSGVPVDLHSRGLSKERLPPQIETAIFRVVQEALTNVLRHAAAKHVSLILERGADQMQVIVEDDGRGFDVDALLNTPDVERRLGLLGMQERVSLVGGTLTIESAPRRGTSLFLRIPLAAGYDEGHHG